MTKTCARADRQVRLSLHKLNTQNLRGYKVLGNKTVELNGKRYDAVTGVFLGNSNKHQQLHKVTSNIKGHHQGRSLDGFAAKSSALAPAPNSKPAKPKIASTRKNTAAKSAVHSVDGF